MNEVVDSCKVSIQTKYCGPTNCRGARIIATVGNGKTKISIPYDHELNSDKNHAEAAKALCEKLNWAGKLVQGATKNGYVFVFVDGDWFVVGSPSLLK